MCSGSRVMGLTPPIALAALADLVSARLMDRKL